MIVKKNKKSPHFFTMLELLVAISIVGLVSGGLFWKISTFVERGRFESDAMRFRSLLLTSRMLAFNTQSDWSLHMKKTNKGWDLFLTCREDPLQQPIYNKLSPIKIQFEGQTLKEWDLEFYSSGRISLTGQLLLLQDKKTSPLQKEIKLPQIFHQKEGSSLGPLHPRDLEANDAPQ